jgi:tripartite-type tricarboxylate transporter receptor subunit TctC
MQRMAPHRFFPNMRLMKCVLVFAGALGTCAVAQTYPDRPIRLVVAFAPGGGTDVAARTITPKLSELLGKQIVVDNRPGAASTLGTELVAKAPADGYTLLMSDTTFGIVPALYPKLNYDAERDFSPISQVTSVPGVLVVHPGVAATNVRELIALAQSRPGQLNFGSGGVGTPVHMAGELLKIAAKIDIVHVPYKGAGPALTDLLGGHFQMMFPTLQSVMPHIKAGRLRVLAVTSEKQTSALPGVPTMAEAGTPGVVAVAWFGVHGPAAMPPAIKTRVHDEIVKALQDSTVRSRFTNEGADVVGSTPQEFTGFISKEILKWTRVVKAAGVKAEF